jgi:predicted ATPase
MGTSAMMQGHFEEALGHLDRAVELYLPEEHRPLASRFGQDLGVSALAFRSWTLWHLGHPDAALVDVGRLLDAAREFGQAPTLIYALFHAAVPEILCGKLSDAEDHVHELMSLADRHGLLFWKSLGLFLQGWCLADSGQGAEAARTLREGFSTYASTGSTLFTPIFSCVMARAQAQQGRFENAIDTVAQALAVGQRTNETWAEAELHRMAGELMILLPRPAPDDAEARFRSSIAIAHRQKARSYELRAATSFARMLVTQGKHDHARDILAPAYDCFTEGFGTRDLQAAKALLDTFQ